MKRVYLVNMRLVESEDSWDEEHGSVINLLDFPIVSLYTEEYISDLVAGRPVSLINGSPEQKPNYESSSEFIQHYENSDVQESSPSRTQSSISDLESSESCSSVKCIQLPTFPTRPRSKWSRPTGPTSWAQIALSLAATYLSSKKTQNFKKKKERRKISVEKLENCLQIVSSDGSSSHETKKCTHCEITKTPQWREGPLGPKTLCNACGVRYRSGRLLPEYRPAASPTFVPYLHSNSHKKVIQIRSKGQWPLTKIEDPPISPEPEFVHSTIPMFDLIYN